MKKLVILILSMSILLSGEMEVDGDLKVTGTVESTTIDSLKAVIADLQAQLAALQGAGVLQTRAYDLSPTPTMNNGYLDYFIAISELIGFDDLYGSINLIDFDINASNYGTIEIYTQNGEQTSNVYTNGNINIYFDDSDVNISSPSPLTFNSHFNTLKIRFDENNNPNYDGLTFTLSITAPFPASSTNTVE